MGNWEQTFICVNNISNICNLKLGSQTYVHFRLVFDFLFDVMPIDLNKDLQIHNLVDTLHRLICHFMLDESVILQQRRENSVTWLQTRTLSGKFQGKHQREVRELNLDQIDFLNDRFYSFQKYTSPCTVCGHHIGFFLCRLFLVIPSPNPQDCTILLIIFRPFLWNMPVDFIWFLFHNTLLK